MNLENATVKRGLLTPENITFYKDQGFLVAPDLLDPASIDSLKKETAEIFRGLRGHIDGLLEVRGLPETEILKKYVAIHFPHKISPLIKASLSHQAIIGILTGIVSPNLKCMQSMLF